MLQFSMIRRRSTPRHSFYSRFTAHDSRSSSAYAQEQPQPQSPHVFTSQLSGYPGGGGLPPFSAISVHGAFSDLVGALKPTLACGPAPISKPLPVSELCVRRLPRPGRGVGVHPGRLGAFSSPNLPPFSFKPSAYNGFTLSPFAATLTDSSQPIENPTALSPFPATLRGRVKHKSFICHSYKKTPGVGTPDCGLRISAETRPLEGTISRWLGSFRSGAGSWDDESVEMKSRRFGHGTQRSGRVLHHVIENSLESLHFGLRADSDANMRRPDGPRPADENISRRHRGDDFFRRALGVEHEAVRLRRNEGIAVFGEPLERGFAYRRIDVLAIGDELRILQAGGGGSHSRDRHGAPAGEGAHLFE